MLLLQTSSAWWWKEPILIAAVFFCAPSSLSAVEQTFQPVFLIIRARHDVGGNASKWPLHMDELSCAAAPGYPAK